MVGGTLLPSLAPGWATGWPGARRCSSRGCQLRTPRLGSNNGVTCPQVFLSLNDGGSRCGGGGCQRCPKKGAPPLRWITKSFAFLPLAGSESGLPGLGACVPGLEGWEQVSCPALPKQCLSVQGLVSAFMIYLKFKSMPGPSG